MTRIGTAREVILVLTSVDKGPIDFCMAFEGYKVKGDDIFIPSNLMPRWIALKLGGVWGS